MRLKCIADHKIPVHEIFRNVYTFTFISNTGIFTHSDRTNKNDFCLFGRNVVVIVTLLYSQHRTIASPSLSFRPVALNQSYVFTFENETTPRTTHVWIGALPQVFYYFIYSILSSKQEDLVELLYGECSKYTAPFSPK